MYSTKAPILPQEIINLIVDEVASKNSPETLRACALVSRSFSSPSRQQLFSEIEIVVDVNIQPRAKRLLEVLKRAQNGELLAFIRSLKVILVPPRQRQPASNTSILSHPFKKSKQMATNIAKKFPRENYLLKLLSLFLHAPLTSFAVDGRRGYPVWKWTDERTNEVVRQLSINPSLKSLRISKIYSFDMSLIGIGEVVHANTLQEFSCIAVSQPLSPGPENITADNHMAQISSRIERLDIRRVSYSGIFRILGRSPDPQLRAPYPFVSFSRLHTLVITISSPDHTISIIWEFILGVANTLESLEIEELGWQGECNDIQHSRLLENSHQTFRTYSA
ncbi:hypothetical protein M413DRAFT_124329 [Hebeloma cylindrosporum]|uniref:F-box domain-containing protein n=1 Tax=Hebeloma cylindrosporum TaxID=76867 RepID=A0A0C3C1N4_HEBCY|nr:hypothetical protein M413DRAFT_124329 [Hebeloma cylindrosporum h7]